MPIRYKFDVLEALKEAGYSTYKIRKEKILSESTVQAFRRGELVAPVSYTHLTLPTILRV